MKKFKLCTQSNVNEVVLKDIWNRLDVMSENDKQQFARSLELGSTKLDNSSYEAMVESIDKFIQDNFTSSIGIIYYPLYIVEGKVTINKVALFAELIEDNGYDIYNDDSLTDNGRSEKPAIGMYENVSTSLI